MANTPRTEVRTLVPLIRPPAKLLRSITLNNVPLEILKKYSSSKPLRRPEPRQKGRR
jgi:hypothetical protein